jgi:hypothetical protein
MWPRALFCYSVQFYGALSQYAEFDVKNLFELLSALDAGIRVSVRTIAKSLEASVQRDARAGILGIRLGPRPGRLGARAEALTPFLNAYSRLARLPAPKLHSIARNTTRSTRLLREKARDWLAERMGFEPPHLLNARNLLILRSCKTYRHGTTAKVRYTADTRRAELRMWWLSCWRKRKG